MVVWPAEQDGNLFIKAGSPPFTFDTFILPIILCITLSASIYFTHEYHNHTYLKDVFTATSKKNHRRESLRRASFDATKSPRQSPYFFIALDTVCREQAFIASCFIIF